MKFKLFFQYLIQTAKLFPKTVIQGMGWLVGFWLISSCISTTLTLGQSQTLEEHRLYFQGAQFFVDIFELLFVWAFSAHYFNKADSGQTMSFMERLGPRFRIFIYTAFTVFGKILLWSLAFVLPGIYKQVVLGAWPYEVLLASDPTHPLKNSEAKVRPVVLPSALLALSLLGIELFTMAYTPIRGDIQQVLVFFLVNFINILLSVFYWGTFYIIYIAHQVPKESQ